MSETSQDISYLDRFEQVASTYQHRQKFARPGEALITSRAYLKWYDLSFIDLPISHEQSREAHVFLRAELESGRLPLMHELGFTVHHRCADSYILYVSTWRHENELWETLYIKDTQQGGQFQKVERENTTPTFCVWVLGVVWHEQQAWTRYLTTRRDAPAKYAYVQDQMTGPV